MAAKVAGTWKAQDLIGVEDMTTVSSTKLWPLGQRCKAKDVGSTDYGFGDFVYCAGVASCARGSVVLIGDSYDTTLVVARDKGALGIALAAVDAATKFGWFQVRGKGVALCDTVSAAAACYIDNTAGQVDDAAVAGDQILGMRTVSANDTGTCVVHMATFPATGDFDNA